SVRVRLRLGAHRGDGPDGLGIARQVQPCAQADLEDLPRRRGEQARALGVYLREVERFVEDERIEDLLFIPAHGASDVILAPGAASRPGNMSSALSIERVV